MKGASTCHKLCEFQGYCAVSCCSSKYVYVVHVCLMLVVVHMFVFVECVFVFQCAFCLWMYGLFDDVCVIVNVASNFGSVCSSLMSVHLLVCARVF